MPHRRTSNAEKALKGTDRKDRLRPEPEFVLLKTAPEPPAWLKGFEALREWKDRTRQLLEAGVLYETSLVMLAHYCALHGACAEKWAESKTPAPTYLIQLRLYGTEFGFTNASLSKAGGGKPTGGGNPFLGLES
jgi:hypothetical protein